MSCLDPGAMLDLLEGRLSPDEEQAAKQHIDGCSECREVFAATARSMQRANHPESTRLPRGKSLGRYLVVSVLGAGGMGVVYDAVDTELDRRVALKVLRPEAGKASERRLVREARAMARIAHPNVVSIYDVGEVDGQAFVAMERIQGVTLTKWLRKSAPGVRAIIETFVAAGRGIAAAHAAGLVHGDFKPDNVILANDGRPRVTDFGLARIIATEQSHRAGTPRYLAPEIWRGAVPTVKSDQFAFGVALWEALYKSRPFEGETVAELARSVCAGRPTQPANSKVPPSVRKVLERALRTTPEERFATMDDLLAALSARGRGRLPFLMGAAAAVALLAATTTFVLHRRSPPRACSTEVDPLAGIWDAPMKARVPSPKIMARLDRWAGDWSAAYAAACAASDLESRCLERQRLTLAEVTRSLGRADPKRAAQVLETLPAHAECADVDALRAVLPAPPGDDVRSALAHARVLEAQEDWAAAAREVESAAAAAKSLDALPLEAEVLHLRGRLSARGGDLAAAERVLREAAEAAQASGHHAEAASIWIDLLTITGDPERKWNRYAEASLARLHGRDDLEAQRLEGQGTEESLLRAIALYRHDADHPLSLVRALRTLARLEREHGKAQQAAMREADALTLAQEAGAVTPGLRF